jgi:hypothetical protein
VPASFGGAAPNAGAAIRVAPIAVTNPNAATLRLMFVVFMVFLPDLGWVRRRFD